MDKEQQFICDFVEKSCQEDRHEECNKEWEGENIIAICKCGCHTRENLVPDSRTRVSRHASVSQKLTQPRLDDFGDGIKLVKQHRTK